MATDNPGEEEPSPYAELEVRFGPAQGGSAKGRVPPEQAHVLFATIGIVTSVAAGIAGAVLTLRINTRLGGPAYAELGIAFGAALLVALRSKVRHTESHKPPEIRARGPGNEPVGRG